MASPKRYDCVIVGAGFSGLCAAEALRAKNLDVLVLEARVRIGGRCQTGSYEGEAFDFGGHWIGAHQPRVRKIITDMGLAFKAQYDLGTHFLDLFGKQYRYEGNISSLNTFGDVLAEMSEHVATWDKEMLLIPLDNPSACPKAAEFDGITLKQWQEKNVKTKEVEMLMNFLLWTIFTVEAKDVSYMWWLYYLRQGHGYSVLSDIRGGAQQDKVVGGCQQICEGLVHRIGSERVILRCPVTKISQNQNGVTIHCTKDRTFEASYVIVTAPPVVCSDIQFEPALPPARAELHKRFRMGNVIKVYVLYDDWWWRKKGLSGEFLSDREPVTLMYDATTDKVPGFIGFIPAHHALKWENESSETLKKAIVEQLQRAFGPDAPKPKEILVRPWGQDDRWSRGGYAGSMSTNTLSVYGSILREPVGRIHWSCAELARDWCGYFEGAVESGQRVAQEILDRAQPRSRL